PALAVDPQRLTQRSGSCAIGPVVTSPADARAECSPPVPTATTRSKIPNKFPATKTRLVAKPGLRAGGDATHLHATPITESPGPAGQGRRSGVMEEVRTEYDLGRRKPREAILEELKELSLGLLIDLPPARYYPPPDAPREPGYVDLPVEGAVQPVN